MLHVLTHSGPTRRSSDLFVAGYLRTGSTKLVRMLAASGDFNDLPLWKALNPSSITGIPGEDPGARIADAEQFLHDLYTGSPGAAAIHEQGDRKSTRLNSSH